VTTVFDHLPEKLRAMVPELDGWTGEPRADCVRCPMVALDGEAPDAWAFTKDTRCCTAHPNLPNWLVGRALARGGTGRTKIVERLGDLRGVTARGIWWPEEYERAFRVGEETGRFGRDVAMRCPYWVGGDDACGIWRDRNAMCRAWYCKHERGLAGGIAWHRADVVVTTLEMRLADLLIARGTPPAEATADAWIAWFAWCAREADTLDAAALAPLVTREIAEARDELVQLKRPRPPMPDIVETSVSELGAFGDEVLLSGYSPYDGVRAPRDVFRFLAKLRRGSSWQRALAATRAELGDPPWLDETLVRELYRVGALREPEE
jgi:hypothetical protein